MILEWPFDMEVTVIPFSPVSFQSIQGQRYQIEYYTEIFNGQKYYNKILSQFQCVIFPSYVQTPQDTVVVVLFQVYIHFDVVSFYLEKIK